MSNGKLPIDRNIFSESIWTSEPFTKGQAWIDLLYLANYGEGTSIRRGIVVDIDRGQVANSEDSLSERWKWSRGKVRRFLKYLEESNKITRSISSKTVQKKSSVSCLITITNYNIIAGFGTESGTENGTENGTEDSTENGTLKKKNKEIKKRNIIPCPDGVSEKTWDDFKVYRNSKKAPITETIVMTFTQQAKIAGISLEEAMQETMLRGWQGFKADWYLRSTQQPKQQSLYRSASEDEF